MVNLEIKLEVGALSETGYVREENQDHMSGRILPLGHVYIVADGMGGHKGGAVASELTDKGLQENIAAAPAGAPVNEVLKNAFRQVNEIVYKKAHSGDPATEGMGSTAVVVLISGAYARVAHVGDSRAYLFRDNKLKRLTKDHTRVQKMIDLEMITAKQAIDHPDASVLERAIGTQPSVEVDISDPIQLKDGDTLFMCSDGLSGYVADGAIESVMSEQLPVQEIPKRLVALALKKGGEDNITVQVIRYGGRKMTPIRTKGKPAGAETRSPINTLLLIFLFAAVLAGAVYLFKMGNQTTRHETAEVNQEVKQEQKAPVEEPKKQSEQLQVEGPVIENTMKPKQISIEELDKENKSLKEELKKAKEKAEKYDKLTWLVVLKNEKLDDKKLPSDDLLRFIEDVGRLKILFFEKNKRPKDLPSGKLPNKSCIYYTKSLDKSVPEKLIKHLKEYTPAEYGSEKEKESLEKFISKTYGANHILLYLK